MRVILHPRLLLGCLLVALGCGDGAPQSGTETSGIEMRLILPGDHQVDEVLYVIRGIGVPTMTGVLDTSAPGSGADLSIQIPAGEGYVVELIGSSVEGELDCRGSGVFDVGPGTTTLVDVTLKCSTLVSCPKVVDIGASPEVVAQGSVLTLSATATDPEGDPIEYRWTGTGGVFADPAAATTQYACNVLGTHTMILLVSDDGFQECIAGALTTVTCGGAAP